MQFARNRTLWVKEQLERVLENILISNRVPSKFENNVLLECENYDPKLALHFKGFK